MFDARNPLWHGEGRDLFVLHVRAECAADVSPDGLWGWIAIIVCDAPRGAVSVKAISPPFVRHVIRGCTLTLPPQPQKVG